MKLARLCFIVFILLDSCIDPYQTGSISIIQHLVVEAMITNEPGPYEVKLFYSQRPEDVKSTIAVERNAKVWIESDAGESEVLIETSPGIYETQQNGIQGKTGVSYKLQILTLAGKQYASEFYKMNSAGALDKVYYEFEKSGASLPQDAKVFSRDILNFYADASKMAGEEQTLFRWRWTGVYQAQTFPEKNKKSLPGGGEVPDPLPCSGYILGPRGLTKVSECTCCICWGYDYNRSSITSENSQKSESTFNRILLNKQLITQMRFYNRYYLEVEQLSVSESEYNFWKLVDKQEEATGNLFQPNSVKIRGNVYCVSDPEEEVLGVFSVSGIKRQSFFIDPQIAIPYPVPIDTLANECKDVAGNSSVVKPAFW